MPPPLGWPHSRPGCFVRAVDALYAYLTCGNYDFNVRLAAYSNPVDCNPRMLLTTRVHYVCAVRPLQEPAPVRLRLHRTALVAPSQPSAD